MRFFKIEDSSNVEAVGYDLEARRLEVKFKGGGHYAYSEVHSGDFAALVCAASVGKHLHANFVKKPKTHPWTRVDSENVEPPESPEVSLDRNAQDLERRVAELERQIESTCTTPKAGVVTLGERVAELERLAANARY